MDSLPERLRALTQNKYFAYIAVIFFAFLTALIFAIFALQSSISPTGDDIRTSLGQEQTANREGSAAGTTGAGGQAGSRTGDGTSNTGSQTEPQSALDRIIAIITGRSTSQNSGDAGSSDPLNSGSQQTGTSAGGQGGTATTQRDERGSRVLDTIEKSQGIPDINIEKYVLVTDLPQQPANMQAYQLKKNFTDAEVSNFATQLGFENVDAVEKGITLSQLYDLTNSHYLGMDTETGYFTFLSETGVPVASGQNGSQRAQAFLNQIGINHPSIREYASYKRSDDESDFTYYEFHQDWDRIGAPVINPIGILNLDETEKVDRLSIGGSIDNRHPDEYIYDTSDNTDGYARADGFNTITVKLSPDGKVYAVSSSIPQIVSTRQLNNADIKSPVEAFDEYKDGITSLALTGPSGEGSVNLADVYSGNLAQSSSVSVRDFEVIYPASMRDHPDWWCPAYVFRSFGQVQTGFDVQYSHMVPASSAPECQTAVLGSSDTSLSRTQGANQLAQNTVPGTKTPPVVNPDGSKVEQKGTGSSSSLQYGTLTFQANVSVNDVPNSECPATEFNHSYKIDETTNYIDAVMWVDKNTKVRQPGQRFTPRDWYFVRYQKRGSTASLESLNPNFSRNDLYGFRSRAFRKSRIGDPNKAPLNPDLDGLGIVSCQFIVTASPWIYAYSPEPLDMTVRLAPVGDVAYVSPAFSDQDTRSWNITTTDEGSLLLDNGLQKNALFWEYHKAPVLEAYDTFLQEHPDQRSDAGFVIARAELETFIGGLGQRLGLTHTERNNLIAELRRESNAVESPFVKLSFVPEAFLNESLPLTVTPEPDTLHRIFIELTPLQEFAHIQQPELPSVTREGVTVIETGYLIHN